MEYLKDNWFGLFIAVILLILVNKACESEAKVTTKTETKTIIVHDTIIKTVISEPETVYVQKIKTVKGDTEIVYVDKTDSTSIKANRYTTEVKSNKATANLKITTTGELLDVTGVITYPEKETITTITKTKDKSGLFMYANMPLNANIINVEAGVIYQFKNKILLMGGVQYNQFTKSADLKAGIGIKLF